MRVLKRSIIVPAVINEIPQKVVIEKKKINLGWSSSSIMNSIRKGLRSTEEIVLEQQINTVPGKPQLWQTSQEMRLRSEILT